MNYTKQTNQHQDDCLKFKIATEAWEFEQIHRLNYQTFVEEIPQHPHNAEQSLVDKYHDQNTYFICVKGDELLGMLAVRGTRPFSLDQKLENLEKYLPPFNSICEIRLLAVKEQKRRSTVFAGILKESFSWGIQQGFDIAVISGTTRQLKLYTHLGFKTFGPLVGRGDACFQPMYLDFTNAFTLKKQSRLFQIKNNSQLQQLCSNYLPGPVTISKSVYSATSSEPCSHRGKEFMADFDALRQELCARVNAHNVQVMTGSGTLANDVVAAHLTGFPGNGLIIVNGEFGNRLVDHAKRFQLMFEVMEVAVGEPIDLKALQSKIGRLESVDWIWTVHCETSTGVINDIRSLVKLCSRENIKLCIDGISTIGACDVDLYGVYIATAVSGKGIGSLPGLCMVFYQDELREQIHLIPRYLDLAFYEKKDGVPFTISSNAVYALDAAIKGRDWKSSFRTIENWSKELCNEIESMGLSIVAESQCRAPHVTTIRLPDSTSSSLVGEALEQDGIKIHYRSEYLVTNNYVQICLMGDCKEPSQLLLNYLKHFSNTCTEI